MEISTLGTYMTAATTAASTTGTSAAADNSSLDMSDFLQLLAAQLQYQDMSNPMDNSEMMAQMTQMASVSAMNNMSEKMNNIAEISTISYAASMIGKELTVVTSQDETTGALTTMEGTVSGVGFYNGEPCVFIDGISYDLSRIMTMGSTTNLSATASSADTSSDTGASL